MVEVACVGRLNVVEMLVVEMLVVAVVVVAVVVVAVVVAVAVATAEQMRTTSCAAEVKAESDSCARWGAVVGECRARFLVVDLWVSTGSNDSGCCTAKSWRRRRTR